MPTIRMYFALMLASGVLLSGSNTSFAQSSGTSAPANSASAAVAAQDDDDATFQPAEPDFRLINLPTAARLPRYKGNFDLTHRFAGNLRRGSFSDNASTLFGIDEGATVGFEYRFAVARHLQAAAYRVSAAQTIQLYAKYDAIRQNASVPLSVSALVSSEGTNNFQDNHAPAVGVTLGRRMGDVAALYLVPVWVHNSAAASGVDRDTSYVGIGGRVRIRPTVYVAAEVSPRLSGFAPGDAEYGFALEKAVGGHMFQLNLANTSASTFAQIARGGAPKSLYLGFNLARKFY
jgi:hypothetical protein